MAVGRRRGQRARFESRQTGGNRAGGRRSTEKRSRRAARPRAKRQWRAPALLSRRRRADNNKQTISRGDRGAAGKGTDPPTVGPTGGRVRRGAAKRKERRAESSAPRDRCRTGRPRRRLSRISDRSRRQNGMRADEDDDANSAHSHLSPSQVIYSRIQSHPQHPSFKCQCHIPVSPLRTRPFGPSSVPLHTTAVTHRSPPLPSPTPPPIRRL